MAGEMASQLNSQASISRRAHVRRRKHGSRQAFLEEIAIDVRELRPGLRQGCSAGALTGVFSTSNNWLEPQARYRCRPGWYARRSGREDVSGFENAGSRRQTGRTRDARETAPDRALHSPRPSGRRASWPIISDASILTGSWSRNVRFWTPRMKPKCSTLRGSSASVKAALRRSSSRS